MKTKQRSLGFAVEYPLRGVRESLMLLIEYLEVWQVAILLCLFKTFLECLLAV